MNNKNYTIFKKRFIAWQAEELKKDSHILKSQIQKDGNIIKNEITKEELLSFKQCYTVDKNEKFYKARQDLPKYWFVSDCGTLISFRSDIPCLIIPSKSGKKIEAKSNNRREQYEISSRKSINRLKLDPAVLVALVFGGDASDQAYKLLTRQGLKALKHKRGSRSAVELHHKEGYAHGETDQKVEEKRAYNADIRRTQFLTREEHDLLTYMPAVDAPREKRIESMIKARNTLPNTHISFVVPYAQKGGTIADKATIAVKDGKVTNVKIGEKELEVKGTGVTLINIGIPGYKVSLRFEDGQEVIREKDLSMEVYDDMMQEAWEIFLRHPISRFPISLKDGREIFAELENDGILV